ncbi:hypothetical protein AALO_G00144670 [Alosa alosa]|uniref:Uncharacterized protein n=1 Tax=Alosa alosa TaxID=278164 RepID=A0AAV6GP92_9TELE|nr:hypothetical protein AALO_G00144670 [Alosa alosa]
MMRAQGQSKPGLPLEISQQVKPTASAVVINVQVDAVSVVDKSMFLYQQEIPEELESHHGLIKGWLFPDMQVHDWDRKCCGSGEVDVAPVCLWVTCYQPCCA